eukprot:scaffold135163_cov139-Phaeocystis_antarctica.AAC.2
MHTLYVGERPEVRSGKGRRVDLEGERVSVDLDLPGGRVAEPLAFARRLVPTTGGIGRRRRASVVHLPICDTGGEVGGGEAGAASAQVVVEHEVGFQGRLRLELGRLLLGRDQELVSGVESVLADGEDGDLGRGCIEDGQSSHDT